MRTHEPPAATVARFLAAMTPFVIFGLLYVAMRLVPSYTLRPIDIQPIYEAERALFGVAAPDGTLLTPSEWVAAHTTPAADVIAGLSYLMWVPLPLLFAFYLFFTGRRTMAFRFAMAFLVVNIVGFTGYYIHPAAPPWYVAQNGFHLITGTHGNAAGLLRFDDITGIPVFHTIYSGNSNVFAAVPSMHAAYCPVACFYAMKAHERTWTIVLATAAAAICWAAVYTSHHYCIDVLLGLATVVLGLTIFESMLMRTAVFRTLFNRAAEAISGPTPTAPATKR